MDASTVEPMMVLPFQQLDRRVVRLWRLRLLAATAVFTAVAAGLARAAGGSTGAALAGLTAAAFGVGLAVLLAPARHRAWGFRIRGGDLLIRRGVLWRAVSVVPHARIQHVDTRHGPIERWLGLSRVIVYTAGSTGASLAIPGLALEEAEALRDRLAALGGGDDAI